MTARIACAAVGVIVAATISPALGYLAAIIAGTWLVLTWRTTDPDPEPAARHSDAVQALERIATKALTGRRRRGGRRR